MSTATIHRPGQTMCCNGPKGRIGSGPVRASTSRKLSEGTAQYRDTTVQGDLVQTLPNHPSGNRRYGLRAPHRRRGGVPCGRCWSDTSWSHRAPDGSF